MRLKVVPLEEEQSRLFEASALDEGNTRPHGGTGLGLAISRQFVQGMSGQMGVESQLGQEATFWLELPLSITELPRLVDEDRRQVEEVDLLDRGYGRWWWMTKRSTTALPVSICNKPVVR